MKQTILEKILPGLGDAAGEITCSVFDKLSDDELIYIAEIYNIGAGRDRNEICSELLLIFKNLMKKEKEMTEGEKVTFTVGGKEYSFNIEYLYDYLYIQQNANIPYTSIQFPESEKLSVLQQYIDYMLSVKEEGYHIVTTNYGPEFSFCFSNYVSMKKFFKWQLQNFADNMFIDDLKEQLFTDNLYLFPKDVIVIKDDKYFKDDYTTSELQRSFIPEKIEYDDTPVLIDGQITYESELTYENSIKMIENYSNMFDCSTFLSEYENNKDQIPAVKVDFYCLFKVVYPKQIEDIIESRNDLHMSKFVHNTDIDEEECLYRSLILVNLCILNAETLQIQKISTQNPNNPYMYSYYEEKLQDSDLAELAIQSIELYKKNYNNNSSD